MLLRLRFVAILHCSVHAAVAILQSSKASNSMQLLDPKVLKDCFPYVQVSPPLVAFRETVFTQCEAPEGVAGKPFKVVEASTPNGCCTLRVHAWPLPSGIASALEEQSELLRKLLNVSSSAATREGQIPGTLDEAPGTSSDGLLDTYQSRTDADVGMQEAAFRLPPGASTSAPSADDEAIRSLRERLVSLCEDSDDKHLIGLLQQAWILGPKRIGPNLLLSRPPGAAASLFEVPQASVVKVG